jgi:parallel beta-helix repeat protein
MRFVVTIAVLALLTASAFSATIYVPDSYTTIQAAILASSNGDTIIVRPGTYVENINFAGKAITLKSEFGPTSVIDGNLSGSVVTFEYAEGADSVLDGFTVRNGSGTLEPGPSTYGGGIYCVGTSPTITNNDILDNTVTHFGGGILCWGGGSPTITNNTVVSNTAGSRGGGIYLNVSATITNNSIRSNGSAGVDGGGIYCDYSSSSTITNNDISDNTATDGGGIMCYLCSSIISSNRITGNTAVDGGGGIGCLPSSDPTITNNTIMDNTATDGGGIKFWSSCSVTITNTILRNNYALTGPEIWIGSSSSPSTISISHSDVEGGQSAVHIESGCILDWGAGMIDADPLFVAGPLGAHYLSQIAAGQSSDSPCLDTGDPDSLLISGSTRSDEVQDGATIDMGFHYPPYVPVPTIRVDGQNGPLNIPSTQTVLITIHLDPGDDVGVTFDSWIFAQKLWGITFSWVSQGTWRPGHHVLSYPLFAIQGFTVHHGTIPVGNWTFAFAVDALNNTYEGTYEDTIEVTSY